MVMSRDASLVMDMIRTDAEFMFYALCIEAGFCTAMTYKGREKIYKAASTRRREGGAKFYAFGIASLDHSHSSGTRVEYNR